MPDFQAISSPSFAKLRSRLRLVASDMDGTLTQNNEFTPLMIQSLQDLRNTGLCVVIVTGRSAGWVSGLVNYLPVAGAIAENGGVFFSKANADPVMLVDIPDLMAHRQKLAVLFAQLQAQWPHLNLTESTDNRFRLTDWTFDVQGLTTEDLENLSQACESAGWGFTYSTVQCHLKLPQQDKAQALLQVLDTQFSGVLPDEVITVGDSPNDATLFNPDVFPHSVGVANIQHYWETLPHHPAFVTASPEVLGFLELSQALKDRPRRLRED